MVLEARQKEFCRGLLGLTVRWCVCRFEALLWMGCLRGTRKKAEEVNTGISTTILIMIGQLLLFLGGEREGLALVLVVGFFCVGGVWSIASVGGPASGPASGRERGGR